MPDVLTHNQTFDSPQAALVHYGVKGMRWGVITKDSPSGKINVKKAEMHDANAARAQAEIDKIRAKPSNWTFVQAKREANIQQLEAYKAKELKNAQDVRDGHLTDGQKKVLTGLAVTGAVLAAYGSYKYVDSGKFNQDKTNVQQLFNGQKPAYGRRDSFMNPTYSADEIHQKIVKGINPDFGALGTKMNCRRCTFAYEMRRRGYDVSATKSAAATGQTIGGLLNATNPDLKLHTGRFGVILDSMKEASSGGPLTDAVARGQIMGKNTIFNMGHRFSAEQRASAIFDALAKEPSGARGEVSMAWKMGGGHSMAWEVIKGRPVIFDCQTGKKFVSPSDFTKHAGVINEIGYTRLDNIALNTEFLKRWLRNAD